ncbi:MAG: hypothetical protein IJ328_08090 [Muribaculaceae bacterium]|nr:hypothetical protein [Muribaculaceae bacterium]
MKPLQLLLLVFISFSLSAETSDSLKISKYRHDFINGEHNIKDFVLDLFDRYDVVILGERDHRDTTQYSFIKNLISDSRFIDNIGYVYTEVGCNTATNSANNLIKGKFCGEKEFRNACIKHLRQEEWWPLWEKWNRYQFLRDLWQINDTLSNDRKITIGLTDVNYPWDNVKTAIDYNKFYNIDTQNRDYIMAANFSYMFNHQLKKNGRHKALLITNAPHAINDSILKNEGFFIKQGYGDRVAIVLMNWDEWWQNDYTLFDNGRVDAAFYLSGNKPTALVLNNSELGEYQINGQQLKNLADAMVFDVSVDKFMMKCGLTGLITPDFEDEIMRRDDIVRQVVYPERQPSSLKNLYDEYNRERCFTPYKETVLQQFKRHIK